MIMDYKEKNVKKINIVKSFFYFNYYSRNWETAICYLSEVLSAESMKLDKLNALFDSRHLIFASKDTGCVRCKAGGLHTGDKYHTQNTAAIGASHTVALRIARALKLQTTAEDLLLPATKDSACSVRRGICYTTECSLDE